MLELQVASENGSQAITGNTIRETEEIIRQILHLDYETFFREAAGREGAQWRPDLIFDVTRPLREAVLAGGYGIVYEQTGSETDILETRGALSPLFGERGWLLFRVGVDVYQFLAARNDLLDRLGAPESFDWDQTRRRLLLGIVRGGVRAQPPAGRRRSSPNR